MPSTKNGYCPYFSQDLGDENVPGYARDARESLAGDICLEREGGAGLGNGGGDIVHHLREGIERFMISDINNAAAGAMAQSEIAIYWDCVTTDMSYGVSFNHIPGGGNVLYMDGHVKFMKYEQYGEFPMNAGWAALVGVASGF